MSVAYASLGFECGDFVPSWLSCGGSVKGRYMLSYPGLCSVDQAFKGLFCIKKIHLLPV